MGKIAKTVFRILFALLSVFVVPHVFPAFLYQTPAVQEHVLLPPEEGSGGPLIVYWPHVVTASEVRHVEELPCPYEVEYEDPGLHPSFPIDVWLELDGELVRLERDGGSFVERLEIRDGFLRMTAAHDPLGRTLVVFKVVSGNVGTDEFNARNYFADWPPPLA
jgi:hypothetical protein